MMASRGVGASLSPEELARWDKEHRALLADVPEKFEVQHYAAIAVLKKKEKQVSGLAVSLGGKQ